LAASERQPDDRRQVVRAPSVISNLNALMHALHQVVSRRAATSVTALGAGAAFQAAIR
jgi:hypothetical protein